MTVEFYGGSMDGEIAEVTPHAQMWFKSVDGSSYGWRNYDDSHEDLPVFTKPTIEVYRRVNTNKGIRFEFEGFE